MNKVGFLFLVFILFTSFFPNKEEIKRMNTPTLSTEIESVVPFVAEINDTIPNDTLLIYLDKNGFPVKYSRKVITGVCIKGECRLVNIELFWNTTGTYLGFELPKSEFLSKTEHVKFKPEEYDRLHELLGDPQSALANYSLNELVPANDSVPGKVDAVSSATIAAVLDYIVEGAVYTTYTLWHIVNGQTKREIEKKTSAVLSANLALELLKSENIRDKVWCLNHISSEMEINPALLSKFIEFISGKDVYLAERSLHALKEKTLTPDVQIELANAFLTSGFLQQRLILQKLKEAENLSPDAVHQFLTNLKNLNGALIKNTFDLFSIHKIYYPEVLEIASELLNHENRYICDQAFQFLENSQTQDKKQIKKMEKYKRKYHLN